MEARDKKDSGGEFEGLSKTFAFCFISRAALEWGSVIRMNRGSLQSGWLSVLWQQWPALVNKDPLGICKATKQQLQGLLHDQVQQYSHHVHNQIQTNPCYAGLCPTWKLIKTIIKVGHLSVVPSLPIKSERGPPDTEWQACLNIWTIAASYQAPG